MPIAATLRSGPRSSAGTQTPLRPSIRVVARPEFGADVDEQLLHPADVGDDVDRVGQPHDRVADQLPRAVPGDHPTAVHVDDRGAVGRPVPRLGPPAGRVDARVLQQQHGVAGGAVGDRLVEAPLLVPGRPVVEQARPDHGERGQSCRHAPSCHLRPYRPP